MKITLYYMPHSPPCRSVMMLANHLGIQFNLKLISIPNQEQLKPSFIKINPQHTVPTIDDNGMILWESRAIMSYMVSKFAKNDILYPTDPYKRAIVDQRLYYDIDILYKSIVAYHAPVILAKLDQPPEEYLPALEKAFELLNEFLKDTKYVAGDRLTIADYSIVVNICTTMAFGFDVSKYDKVAGWYARCKKVMKKDGFQELNEDQAKILGQFYLTNLKT